MSRVDTVRDAYSDATDPGRNDILARSEDINNGTVIREGGTSISDGACTNCDSGRGTGWGSATSISVRVTSGNLLTVVPMKTGYVAHWGLSS